jgi:hypothetical protein
LNHLFLNPKNLCKPAFKLVCSLKTNSESHT